MSSIITIPRSAPITDMVIGYDGVHNYLAVPQILLGQPLSSFSVEFWVNLSDAAAAGTVWANNDGTFTLVFQPVTVSPPAPPQARLALIVGAGSTPLVYTPIFNVATWYYVVSVFDSTTKTTTLYVDAVAYSPSPLASAPNISLGPATVGAAQSANFLNGAIGQMRLWRGALDAASVKQLQYMWLSGAAVVAGGQATLIANWHANEGYGDFAFDYTGNADATLGDGAPGTRPSWQVSTILKPPDFITFPPSASLASGLHGIRTLSARDLSPPVDQQPSLLDETAGDRQPQQ